MIAMKTGRFKDFRGKQSKICFISGCKREKKIDKKCAMYTCHSYFIENENVYDNPIYWTYMY